MHQERKARKVREQQAHQARPRRTFHEVVKDHLSAMGLLLIATTVIVLGFGVLCQVIGLMSLTTYFAAVAALTQALIVLSTVGFIVAPIIILISAYGRGSVAMRQATFPHTATVIPEHTPEEIPTGAVSFGTLNEGLKALGLPGINRAVKEDKQPCTPLAEPYRDGNGYTLQFALPPGTTSGDLMKHRDRLAGALMRSRREVWVAKGATEGSVDLWVADPGTMTGTIGEWPGAPGDIFSPIPFGQTLRGEPFDVTLVGRHTLIGGQPEQGKSNAARVLLAGAALDPTVELVVLVPVENNDFTSYATRGAVIEGADEEAIAQIMQKIHDLCEEMAVRGKLLKKYGINEVNRQIASQGVGLHPVVILLEEAHMLFTHPVHGKAASEMWTKLVLLSRKVGMWSITSTQSPTRANLPRDVTRNTTIGMAFSVSDYVANDGLLGEGAYSAGVRATDFVPGEDRGTCLVRGLSPVPMVVRTWKLSGAPDLPPAPVMTSAPASSVPKRLSIEARKVSPTGAVARSTSRRAPEPTNVVPLASRRQPVTPTTPAQPEANTSLLDVIAETFEENETELTAAEVSRRLKRRYPFDTAYQALTGPVLRARLQEEFNIVVPSTGNRYPISLNVIQSRQERAENMSQ